MRIAVCSTGRNLNSPVDDRFGRCAYFVLVDENGNHIQTVANSAVSSPQGAGIAAAQLLIDHQVDTVLAGRVGPKAIKPLKSAGIKVFTGISGTVNESLENFRKGKLSPLEQANAAAHGGGRARGGR